MMYYLSSYKLGRELDALKGLINKTSGVFGYIPNALDFTDADPVRRKRHIGDDMEELRKYGVAVELLDLKDYFGKEENLKIKLQTLGGIYVSGGNSFVLRQAMRLSGLDKLLKDMSSRNDFLYIAYSAGVCVLTQTLKYYALTDNAKDFPYPQLKEQVWEGLGVLDFVFEPHYDSNHPESESTGREIKMLIDDKILFKAYRDGDVLIMED